jgi:hypothetical protein
MFEEILDGFQSLHFHTLTLSSTRVKRWSNIEIISLIGPMMCASFARDGKTQLRAHKMVFRNVR